MKLDKIIKNKSLCVLPWSGFELEPNGEVKNCVLSKQSIGNINIDKIENILQGEKNSSIKEKMWRDKKPSACSVCHLQEQGRNKIDSISSRLYYIKQLAPHIKEETFDSVDNFDLRHVDLRWSNQCNQACVYCHPFYSSKWATELGLKIKSNEESKEAIKNYVFDNAEKLKNVYLAGGEPLLMKDNLEFLEVLEKKNPNVNLRINTNLSKTGTKIFDKICNFKNVHWTISVEALEERFEYIRYLGKWKDFRDNLEVIKKLQHKTSFNMVFFILNYKHIYDCIRYLQAAGYHENDFIIGPLYKPLYYSVLNLPEPILKKVKKTLEVAIDNSNFNLKNSFENILKFYNTEKFQPSLKTFFEESVKMDERRNTNWKKVFPEIWEDLNGMETYR